jgi:hypothetical protein
VRLHVKVLKAELDDVVAVDLDEPGAIVKVVVHVGIVGRMDATGRSSQAAAAA